MEFEGRSRTRKSEITKKEKKTRKNERKEVRGPKSSQDKLAA
jgi:hypothetical protein